MPTRKEVAISAMVDKFLGWKLPADFCPDAGISFDRRNDPEGPHWPVGTNLLTAEQARQMFEHVAADVLADLGE